MSKPPTHLEKLKSATNRKELAVLLGYKPSAMTSIIYKTPIEQRYNEFEIPKKNGGVRLIKAPSPKLKVLQSRLANYLYACLEEIEESRKTKSVSHGFRKSVGIVSNAKSHKNRRFVLNIDLENFFPSFHFGRVRGFFLKDKCFELNEEVATTIAQIACDGQALPQGSPCSPVISELVGQILDLRLLRFAKKNGVRYSRYADDLTFSTNQKSFPSQVAIQDKADASKWTLGKALVDKIEASGFRVNTSKTRMHIKGSRQRVNGLVVNEKANIASHYYRRTRAMCDSLFANGNYFKETKVAEIGGAKEPVVIKKLAALEGMLSHIYYVTQSEEKRNIQEQRTNPRAIRKLFRRFLFYKHCIALSKPLIITEGKTDPIYLREAIRHLPPFQPQLGQKGKNGFQFSISFFKYQGRLHEIMDLGGGSGDLKSVIFDYVKNLEPKKWKMKRKPMAHLPMKHPVILLVDNDEGLAPVTGPIRKQFDVDIKRSYSQPFYYIGYNLYLVKTPEDAGDSCIEDLFPREWLVKKLNGKSLSLKSKIDPSKEYGKEVFAKQIVLKHATEIDFKGFIPLLERVKAVISDYEDKLKGAKI